MEEFDISKEFIKKIQNRMIKYNQNWLCIIVGNPGSGKSISSLAVADKISINGINPKTHIVFKPQELMKLLNSKILKKGDVIIFEEAGVGIAAKQWYSLQNKLIGYIMQTFRDLNIGVIFNVPIKTLIDKSARELFHTEMETLEIDRKKNFCRVRLYELKYNSKRERVFTYTYKFINNEGNLIHMPQLEISLPRKELIEEYEKISSKYKQSLRQSVENELEEIKREEDKSHACYICGGTAYNTNKTKHTWTCRKCLEVYTENPYKRTHT